MRPAARCPRRRATALVALALSFGLVAQAAVAQTRPTFNAGNAVDLALVLAVDASGSISDDRWELERNGYAAAFRDPEVIKAITSGGIGAIAVTMFVWSSSFQQQTVVPWTRISDAASAAAFANSAAQMPHPYKSWTSISAALAYGVELHLTDPYAATRRVIDISGDGPDSTSELIIQGTRGDLDQLVATRDRVVGQGYVINGLPIVGDPRIRDLDRYYQYSVIGGPGSFFVVARDFAVFAEAVKRKLILEIADRGGAHAGVAPARYDEDRR